MRSEVQILVGESQCQEADESTAHGRHTRRHCFTAFWADHNFVLKTLIKGHGWTGGRKMGR